MRTLSLLPVAAALAACTTATAPPIDTEAEARLAAELAGLVAGPPQACLAAFNRDDMTIIDDSTILFREGNRVWVNEVQGGCDMAGHGRTLIFRTTATSLCRGDVAQIADLNTGITFGSCMLGEFVPYTRP